MALKPLSMQQLRFIEGYVAGKPAKRAYIDAGYKARGNVAETNAARMLRNAQVATEIETIRREAANRIQITAERVLQELARIAFSNIGHLFDDEGNLLPFDELDPDTTAALSVFDVCKKERVSRIRVKLWSKTTALELLGKQLGMFGNRGDTTGLNKPGTPTLSVFIRINELEQAFLHELSDDELRTRIAELKARITESDTSESMNMCEQN